MVRHVYDHLRAIVAGVGGEAKVARWRLVTDPWPLPAGGRNFHLQSVAASSIAIAATAGLKVPPFLSVQHALADRCDRVWQDMNALSLETVVVDPTATTQWLVDNRLVAETTELLHSVATERPKMLQHRRLITDPVSYFDFIPATAAREALATPLNRFLSTASGGQGLPALVGGWSDPHEEGSRLDAWLGTLRFLPAIGATVLRCRCIESPSPAEVSIYVDGKLVPTFVEEDGYTLLIPIPARATGMEDRAVTIEFVDNRLNADTPFGVTGYEVSGSLGPAAWIDEGGLVDTLAAAGFSRRAEGPVLAQDVDGAWLQSLIAERGAKSLLIISDDAGAALTKLQLDLPAGTIAAASITTASEPDVPAPQSFFYADLSGSIDWPKIAKARFDLIHLHEVVRFPDLTAKLFWLTQHLSFQGILSGTERSVQEARDVVAALGRGIGRRYLTFLLDGSRWRAIPHSHWRA